MLADTALRALADALEVSENDTVTIEQVAATTDGAELQTELTVSYPFELLSDAEAASVTDCEFVDGRLAIDISMDVDPENLDVSPGTDEATETDDGTRPTDEDGSIDKENPDTPAYKDPDRLREVYAEYDSFSAMKDALDVDVTAQTVRRNMMKKGIHSPDTADEDADTDTESVDDSSADDEPEFDDTTLPEGITPAAVRDAVAESSSLHGAQTALGLDIKETRALLQDLGVLEHVTGRISNQDAKPDVGDIEQQIYDSLTAHADGGDVER